MSDECIFCHHDPYHYVDIGVGFQAAAVTCCELGVALYQYGDEDVTKVADRIEELEAKLKMAIEALEAGVICTTKHGGAAEFLRIARTTLADLKGEQP